MQLVTPVARATDHKVQHSLLSTRATLGISPDCGAELPEVAATRVDLVPDYANSPT